MSTKRTSPESSDDEPANQGSDSVLQEDENSKRAKLASLSDTTLQDLPIELIECILIKVIVMEVQDMKLMKSERKGKAGPVIDRLRTVCSKWDSILTTNFFRNELNRTFDAQKTIRLEILHQCQTRFNICSLTTLKDEIFLLRGSRYEMSKNVTLDVYDCDNMAVVKDVIPLPEMYPICIETCSLSNCVYVLHKRTDYMNILRITRDDDHQFHIRPLITDVWMPNNWPNLSITDDGSLILAKQQKDIGLLAVIFIYDANGSVQHQIRLSSEIPEFSRIIAKPNGNLVLVSAVVYANATFTEINLDATIIRQYQTPSFARWGLCKVCMSGRMLLIDGRNRIELLDSELNLLDVSGPQLTGNKYIYNPGTSRVSRDRNEFVAVVCNGDDFLKSMLTLFRCIEE